MHHYIVTQNNQHLQLIMLYINSTCEQRDHSPDDVKFPDSSPQSCPHIMPVLVLLSVVGVGMQQCMIPK